MASGEMAAEGDKAGGEPAGALFRFCTLVTDNAEYQAMRESFTAAGMVEPYCVFQSFDNTQGNRFEPYSLINRLVADAKEPYVVLCHQDLRLDQGHGFEQLYAQVKHLDAIDGNWAVAGTAGCSDDFEFAVMVKDPNDFPLWKGRLPLLVHSLDENFLVIRTAARVGCSPGLSGFHLYGTDVCMNARLGSHGCYVIDFRARHLSAGHFDDDFFRSREAFIRHWSPRFFCLYVIREAEIVLSRWPRVASQAGRVKVKRLLRRWQWTRRLMTWELPGIRKRPRQPE